MNAQLIAEIEEMEAKLAMLKSMTIDRVTYNTSKGILQEISVASQNMMSEITKSYKKIFVDYSKEFKKITKRNNIDITRFQTGSGCTFGAHFYGWFRNGIKSESVNYEHNAQISDEENLQLFENKIIEAYNKYIA